jgi:glutamate-1-semialdehyde 2,1-aminomutase
MTFHYTTLDRGRLRDLIARERASFGARNRRSGAHFDQSAAVLLDGVPMTWMRMWPGGFPLVLRDAHDARLTDIDGHEYIDFCLGDSGAMAGHAPDATAAAVDRQYRRGTTAMLPTTDATWVADELRRRFRMGMWQFALSATDANRWMLRIARYVTGRPKILVFSHNYHGTVDEVNLVIDGKGQRRTRHNNLGAPVDPRLTSKVVEWNDVDALEDALRPGDVACVLAEPALTNIGIVLPEPGFHDSMRRITRSTGTLLIIDETHTLSAGPGGYTGAYGLEPDAVTLGKAIAGGIPIGAYGVTTKIAALLGQSSVVEEDTGMLGGTLAGNALSMAAARATLENVLTDAAFAHMTRLAERYTAGMRQIIADWRLPWHIVQLGARAEFRFCVEPPMTGGASAAATDSDLDEYLHLFLLNRGVLITPFHNMALMCPKTTSEDVDCLLGLLSDAVSHLIPSGRPVRGMPQ